MPKRPPGVAVRTMPPASKAAAVLVRAKAGGTPVRGGVSSGSVVMQHRWQEDHRHRELRGELQQLQARIDLLEQGYQELLEVAQQQQQQLDQQQDQLQKQQQQLQFYEETQEHLLQSDAAAAVSTMATVSTAVVVNPRQGGTKRGTHPRGGVFKKERAALCPLHHRIGRSELRGRGSERARERERERESEREREGVSEREMQTAWWFGVALLLPGMGIAAARRAATCKALGASVPHWDASV